MLSLRRENIVRGLGVLAGAMLLLSFFLPRGSSNHWQFGWNANALPMVIEILQIFIGIALIAAMFLPLPRFLKGVGLLAMGVLLSGLLVFDSIDSFGGFFSRPAWIDRIVWMLFPAVAAVFAFNSDSDKPRSARTALGLVGGAAMLVLAIMPMSISLGSSLRPFTAFLEAWDVLPRMEFAEFLFMSTWIVVICMGPIAGALLMFHAAVSIVAPEKRVRGAGPVAGVVFLLWYPATFFVFFLFLWAKIPIVFSSYVVHVAPTLGCGFLLAAGVYYFGEALIEEPQRADSIHPGLGALIRGAAMAPLPAGAGGYTVPPTADTGWSSAPAAGGPPAAASPPEQGWGAPSQPQGAAPPQPQGAAWGEQAASDWDRHDEPAGMLPASAEQTALPPIQDPWGAPPSTSPPAPAAGQEDWEKPTQALDISQFADVMEPEPKPGAQVPQDDNKPTQALDIGQIEAFTHGDAAQPQGTFSLDEHWERGSAAWSEQRWDDALYHYGEVLRMQPTRTEATRALADIHYGLGNLDEAETFYRQVLVTWPNDDYAKQALDQIALYRK